MHWYTEKQMLGLLVLVFLGCTGGPKAVDTGSKKEETPDTTAPVLSWISTPSTPTNQNAASFQLTATDSESGINSIMCQLDSAKTASCSTALTFNALSEGTHHLKVVATDKAGNVSLPLSHTWVIDLTPPVPVISSKPANPTTQTTANFQFSATDALSGVQKTECRLDGTAFQVCASPLPFSSLAVGQHNFDLRATDVAGNAATVSFSWTILTPKILEPDPGPGIDTYKSDLYSVEVYDGMAWVPSYTYKYERLSRIGGWFGGQNASVNFTTFGTNNPTQVRVTKLTGSITSVKVSPKSKNISAQVSGSVATLTLDQNQKVWITINNDEANSLFVFADSPKPIRPQRATYFGRGIHTLAPGNNNHYQAQNNEIIYIDAGAWVRGNIWLKGTTGVQIMGPGILSGDLWLAENINPIHNVDFSAFVDYALIRGDWLGNDATISGVTLVDSASYMVAGGIRYAKGVKELSPWYWNSDGFNGVPHIDQSFSFVGDNVFGPNYQSDNTTWTNNFACTSTSAVFAPSYWGYSSTDKRTHLVDNIDIKTFNNYNITSVIQIWIDNTDPTYGVFNQTFQNIRVEGNILVPLITLKNVVYPWAGANAPNPALGNSYNLVFKNITLEGTQSVRSEILGWDSANQIHEVTLENVRINQTQINSTNVNTYFNINSFVTGLVIQ